MRSALMSSSSEQQQQQQLGSVAPEEQAQAIRAGEGRSDMAYYTPLDRHIIIITAALLLLLLAILLLNLSIRVALRCIHAQILMRRRQPSCPAHLQGLTPLQLQALPTFTFDPHHHINARLSAAADDVDHYNHHRRLIIDLPLVFQAGPSACTSTTTSSFRQLAETTCCKQQLMVSDDVQQESDQISTAMINTNIIMNDDDAVDGFNNIMITCPICLADFMDGDTLRILPACHHYFHAGCIDVWLAKTSSCPACRASLLVDQATNKNTSKL